MANRVSKAIAKTVAKKAPAKKAPVKQVKKETETPVKSKGVYAKMVRPNGEIRLSNEVRTSCGVGRNGPVVEVGTRFEQKGGEWEPVKYKEDEEK